MVGVDQYWNIILQNKNSRPYCLTFSVQRKLEGDVKNIVKRSKKLSVRK